MGKFKEYVSKNTLQLKQVYLRYTGTILCGFLVSLVNILVPEDNRYIYDTILPILFLWLAGNFMLESVVKIPGENESIHRRKYLPIGYTVTLVIAILLKATSDYIDDAIVDEWEIKKLIIFSIVSFYVICMLGIALFTLIRQQKISVCAYIGRMGFALLRALGMVIVLNLATFLLFWITDSLLFDVVSAELMENIQILLAAGVYLPVCLMALSDTREDNSAFTKKFVSYALMPCVWAAMVIIYLYVFKIFVTRDIPSNEIFGICQWLFILGAPIWMMSSAFVEDQTTWYFKLVANTRYIYAPFVLLEIYSIGIRIYSYGLTESRYMAVMFILVQLIYIFWEQLCVLYAKMRKRKVGEKSNKQYEGLIIVLIGICFISLLLPFGNACYLSFASQRNRLEKYQTEDKVAAGEAYRYLKYNPYGSRYIDKELSEEDIELLESEEAYGSAEDIDWEYVSIHTSVLSEGLPIGPDYKMLYQIHERFDEERSLDVFEAVSISIGDRTIQDVDLRDCIRYYADLDAVSDEIDEKEYLYEVQINEKTKLIVNDISFDYTYGMKEIQYFNISGFILEK